MKSRKIVFYIAIFTIVIMISAIFVNRYNKGLNDKLKNTPNFTIGYFLSYYELADSGTPIVEYYYYVNKRKFNGSAYTNTKYKYCKNNIQCKEKKFWVIYSLKNPKISLIDLTEEIQTVENPPFPKTLDNFK